MSACECVKLTQFTGESGGWGGGLNNAQMKLQPARCGAAVVLVGETVLVFVCAGTEPGRGSAVAVKPYHV